MTSIWARGIIDVPDLHLQDLHHALDHGQGVGMGAGVHRRNADRSGLQLTSSGSRMSRGAETLQPRHEFVGRGPVHLVKALSLLHFTYGSAPTQFCEDPGPGASM